MRDAKARAKAAAGDLEKQYGLNSGATGRFDRKLNVVPTGSIALDYALGTGGWPLGHPVEVFGPPDIGKSSIIGFSAIRQAQKMGMVAGIVAIEPGFDPDWAAKNGVDLDTLVVSWPNDGQEAFNVLFDWMNGDTVDYVVFDSIGAILRPSEAEVNGKPNQGGQSGLITWGVKRTLMPCWKRNKGLMYLNQIRDDMKAQMSGVYDSPGGHALKHSCAIRVQLRPGKDRFNVKDAGDDVMIGRSIVAVIKRNKLSEGTGKRAIFDFYSMETENGSFPFGIDQTTDVINTGKRTGVITLGGSWYYHELFPDGKLQGEDKVRDHLVRNPDHVNTIRTEILSVMLKRRKSDQEETVG
jgi:recombination protein RecA